MRTSLGAVAILGEKSGGAGRGLLWAVKLACPLLLTLLLLRPLIPSPPQARRHFLILILISQGLSFQALTRVETDGLWIEMSGFVMPVIVVAVAPFGLWLLAFLANILLSHSPASTSPFNEQDVVVVEGRAI